MLNLIGVVQGNHDQQFEKVCMMINNKDTFVKSDCKIMLNQYVDIVKIVTIK